MHPPVYLKSSLDYLYYLIQCKCYANYCQGTTNSSFDFWNFLEFLPPTIFSTLSCCWYRGSTVLNLSLSNPENQSSKEEVQEQQLENQTDFLQLSHFSPVSSGWSLKFPEPQLPHLWNRKTICFRVVRKVFRY